jgi:hypothetical protein
MPTNRSPLKRRKARGREISATTLSIWSQLLELRPLGSLYRTISDADLDRYRDLCDALERELHFDITVGVYLLDDDDLPGYIANNPLQLERWLEAKSIRHALNAALRQGAA